MPRHRLYDRFFLEEFMKKFGTQERLDELHAMIKNITAEAAQFISEFEQTIVEKYETAHEKEERLRKLPLVLEQMK